MAIAYAWPKRLLGQLWTSGGCILPRVPKSFLPALCEFIHVSSSPWAGCGPWGFDLPSCCPTQPDRMGRLIVKEVLGWNIHLPPLQPCQILEPLVCVAKGLCEAEAERSIAPQTPYPYDAITSSRPPVDITGIATNQLQMNEPGMLISRILARKEYTKGAGYTRILQRLDAQAAHEMSWVRNGYRT